MELQTVYEIIGYLASVLIAVSMMMRSILRLRIINLVGAALFTVYGLAIGALPVAAVNLFIALVNVYHLYQIYSTRERFNLVDVAPEAGYLHCFLDFYAAEIRKFVPDFAFNPARPQLIFFILRDAIPAGLFIAERIEPGALFVHLDFVIPGYRDFKVGRFLYTRKRALFQEQGIERIYSRPGSPAHAAYLQRMGFEAGYSLQGEPVYCLRVGQPTHQAH